MITIDKNVPMKRARAQSKYPFGDMDIGDSFFVEKGRKQVACAASSYGKRNRKKYAVRAEGDGARCWRTA